MIDSSLVSYYCFVDCGLYMYRCIQYVCYTYTGSSVASEIEPGSTGFSEHALDDKPRPYFCTVSGKRFTTTTSSNNHRKSSLGEKLYSCSQCEKRFSAQKKLRRHMNIHTSRYKCRECGRCCQSNNALVVHWRSHSEEKSFECTVCSKRYFTTSDLARHSRFHTGEKPYECRLCDKAFSRAGTLNSHMRVHTGDRHTEKDCYSCTQCGKRFSRQNELCRHVNIHSGRYKCGECGRCCRSSTALAIHRRSHSGERPFECTVCGKEFPTSSELVRHGRTHSGERPYKCYLCEKAFRKSASLSSHTRVHTGQKRCICSVCNKSFVDASSLQLHQFRVLHVENQQKVDEAAGTSVVMTTVTEAVPGSGLTATVMSQHQAMADSATSAAVALPETCLPPSVVPETLSGPTERPFECTVCGQGFTTSRDLVAHSRIHDGRNIYIYVLNVRNVFHLSANCAAI